ncbi:MAG: lactate utilization protein [Saprospiraceae bacterium]|nr:lactate utilization protein [Saprospiraceae bacterium]
MAIPKDFLDAAREKAFSRQHRSTIQFNMQRYHNKVSEGKGQFRDLEKARSLAAQIKKYTIQNLPDLLLEFEYNFTKRGGKVIWAENVADAQKHIDKILTQKEAKSVVKGKSMISEEIELNEFLEKKNIAVHETDLGEFIVQILGQKPYHIVTPAMHLRKTEIAAIFNKHFDTPLEASAEELTHFARQYLRKRFEEADIGFSGGNFLIADTGSLVLVENEGNIRLSTSLPKTHIAIVGLEKVLPSIQDLALFLPLLATYGTGQQLTTYNTILSGPKQADETDGPEEMYVILLDNGRSDMLADPKQREALHCIRCGSCLNACPVYQNIGGHSYNTAYTGPIGSVIMPFLGENATQHAHLANASSLCGNCSASCPVNIPLHELLLHNRHLEKQRGDKTKNETRAWYWWKQLMKSRFLMNAPQITKKLTAKLFLNKIWSEQRQFPEFPKQTFNQLWKKGKV